MTNSPLILYETITANAAPTMAIVKFTESDAIAAENVRVYNASNVEVFVSFGSSTEGAAVAMAPKEKGISGSFPVAPHSSEILYKGSGMDQVASITNGGIATVRFTAVKLQNSGDDIMGALGLIPVLKDAMGSQKMIEAAAAKIAKAHEISDQKRKELEQANQTIAHANLMLTEASKQKAENEHSVAAHTSNVSRFNAFVDEQQASLDKQKEDFEVECAKKLAEIAKEKAEAQVWRDEATKRETSALAKEKANKDASLALANDAANHIAEKQKFAENVLAHEQKEAAFSERKKKFEDALRG